MWDQAEKLELVGFQEFSLLPVQLWTGLLGAEQFGEERVEGEAAFS